MLGNAEDRGLQLCLVEVVNCSSSAILKRSLLIFHVKLPFGGASAVICQRIQPHIQAVFMR